MGFNRVRMRYTGFSLVGGVAIIRIWLGVLISGFVLCIFAVDDFRRRRVRKEHARIDE